MKEGEFELSDGPSDTISSVKFAKNDNLLVVSSWDNVNFLKIIIF